MPTGRAQVLGTTLPPCPERPSAGDPRTHVSRLPTTRSPSCSSVHGLGSDTRRPQRHQSPPSIRISPSVPCVWRPHRRRYRGTPDTRTQDFTPAFVAAHGTPAAPGGESAPPLVSPYAVRHPALLGTAVKLDHGLYDCSGGGGSSTQTGAAATGAAAFSERCYAGRRKTHEIHVNARICTKVWRSPRR